MTTTVDLEQFTGPVMRVAKNLARGDEDLEADLMLAGLEYCRTRYAPGNAEAARLAESSDPELKIGADLKRELGPRVKKGRLVQEDDRDIQAHGQTKRERVLELLKVKHVRQLLDPENADLLGAAETGEELGDPEILEDHAISIGMESWTDVNARLKRTRRHRDEAQAQIDAVWEAIASTDNINGLDRKILVHAYGGRRTDTEIASLVGLNPGTVEKKRQRALDKVTEVVELPGWKDRPRISDFSKIDEVWGGSDWDERSWHIE